MTTRLDRKTIVQAILVFVLATITITVGSAMAADAAESAHALAPPQAVTIQSGTGSATSSVAVATSAVDTSVMAASRCRDRNHQRRGDQQSDRAEPGKRDHVRAVARTRVRGSFPDLRHDGTEQLRSWRAGVARCGAHVLLHHEATGVASPHPRVVLHRLAPHPVGPHSDRNSGRHRMAPKQVSMGEVASPSRDARAADDRQHRPRARRGELSSVVDRRPSLRSHHERGGEARLRHLRDVEHHHLLADYLDRLSPRRRVLLAAHAARPRHSRRVRQPRVGGHVGHSGRVDHPARLDPRHRRSRHSAAPCWPFTTRAPSSMPARACCC